MKIKIKMKMKMKMKMKILKDNMTIISLRI